MGRRYRLVLDNGKHFETDDVRAYNRKLVGLGADLMGEGNSAARLAAERNAGRARPISCVSTSPARETGSGPLRANQAMGDRLNAVFLRRVLACKISGLFSEATLCASVLSTPRTSASFTSRCGLNTAGTRKAAGSVGLPDRLWTCRRRTTSHSVGMSRRSDGSTRPLTSWRAGRASSAGAAKAAMRG